ncbi:hypothetical protein PAE9249_02946 [Paenibacillus sp. CECT 9249]|nr:hypothetical protein PAE9249_02946 [Paenibacillus sp. CECT 9249]
MRSSHRDKALETFIEYGGGITNGKIAEMLNEKEKTISNWKSRDQWNVVLQKGERSTTKKIGSKVGDPIGNKNALGNEGGAPKGNSNAVTHGFFRKFFPEDTLEIMGQIADHSPLDMLWDQITIQYTAIIQAQQIMYVLDKKEMIKS